MSAETPNRQPSPRLRAYAEAVEPSPAEIDRAWERFEAEREHRAVATTGSRLDRGRRGRGLAVAAAALLIVVVGGAAAAGLVQTRLAASSQASTDVVQAVRVAERSTTERGEASGSGAATAAPGDRADAIESSLPAPVEDPMPEPAEPTGPTEPAEPTEWTQGDALPPTPDGSPDHERPKKGVSEKHPVASEPQAAAAAGTDGETTVASGTNEGDLAAERRLLSRAQRAATRKAWSEANRWLDRHAADYPDGQLVELRLGLGAIVACSEGNKARGEGLSRKLAKRQPGSPLLTRARAACKAAE